MKIVSLVERNGRKQSHHVANVNVETVRPILEAQIAKKARLVTDEAGIYKKVGKQFAEHGVVNHSPGVDGKWVQTGSNDKQRADALLKSIGGKRLTYRRAC
jgi:hypothetical protein